MRRRSNGQGFVEYALIILLIVLVVVAALALIGPTLAHIFSALGPTF
jgi:Flp pilus assembly pilin Flp